MKCPIQKIVAKTREAGVPFLVVGGYAVLAHGYVRMTDDLDLLAQRGQRKFLEELFGTLGMSVSHDATTFLQFDPKNDDNMKVDLIFRPIDSSRHRIGSGRGSGKSRGIASLDSFEMPCTSKQQIPPPAQRHGRFDSAYHN